MIKILLIIGAFVSCTFAFWSACPGGSPAPNTVTSPNCTTNKCEVYRGSILTGNVFFTPNNAYGDLRGIIEAYVFGQWTGLPITPPDDEVCRHLFRGGVSASCPTTANQEYEWHLNFEIDVSFPQLLDTTFQFRIESGGQIVTCFQLIADMH